MVIRSFNAVINKVSLKSGRVVPRLSCGGRTTANGTQHKKTPVFFRATHIITKKTQRPMATCCH